MSESVDVIVVGGGINGLVAACTLARGGRSVVLCERRAELGGLAASEEFHPGYHTNGTLFDTACFDERAERELDLARFGFSRRASAPEVHVAGPEGCELTLCGDPRTSHASMAEHSERDAAAYTDWRAEIDRWRPFLARILSESPPDIEATDLAGGLELAKKGFQLRRLGERDMIGLLRTAPLSLSDWLGAHFESELVRAALAAPALEGACFGPRAAGGAALLLLHEALRGAPVAGGARALVAALEECARAAGVELRTACEVTRIEVSTDGVQAVELAHGERLACRAVLAAVSPRQTLLELLPPTAAPPSLVAAGEAMRSRGGIAVIDVALSSAFELAGSADVAPERLRTARTLDELERAADALKYREVAAQPWLEIACPSVEDPSLAPDGHALLTVHVHCAPRTLEGGWTEDARGALRTSALETLFNVAPNARDAVVAVRLRTPAELESDFRLPGGHLHHLEASLDQLFLTRPTMSCARYATPLPGLFIAGSGSHPGGRISGIAGRLGARAVERLAFKRRGQG